MTSILSGIVLNNVATLAGSLLDELHTEKLYSKIKYLVKKWLLPKAYCLIIDDYSYSQLNLDTSDKSIILIHPETIYSIILSESDQGNLNNLKISSFDTYLLVVLKKVKKIIMNMRFLHSKSTFIIVVSSYHIAKKLHFNDKNIVSFCIDDDLFKKIKTENSFNPIELNQFVSLRNQQLNDKHLIMVESYKQLNNAIIDISKNKFKILKQDLA